MKGVFRLTAEKERPSEKCSPQAWLRTALWWYLRGKVGLEVLLQRQRPRGEDGMPRELLTQPHVDLAKTWWIISDPLEAAGQDMDEEAADELVSTQCHRFLFGVATIILPLEANLAVLDIEDAIVGDVDTVCVAADVLQDLLWSGERALGIDHPCDRRSPGKENGM